MSFMLFHLHHVLALDKVQTLKHSFQHVKLIITAELVPAAGFKLGYCAGGAGGVREAAAARRAEEQEAG